MNIREIAKSANICLVDHELRFAMNTKNNKKASLVMFKTRKNSIKHLAYWLEKMAR